MKCPICNFEKSRPLKGYKKDFLVKCSSCSLVFSNKKPTKKEINDIYSNYDYLDISTSEITKNKIRKKVNKLFLLNKPHNILDIGCGESLHLDEFKKLGCKTYATEYDERLAEFALKKGHEIVGIGLFPEFSEGKKMDMIILTEVIEHVTKQRQLIPHLRNMLTNNGIIYITTPNFDSLERRIFKNKWEFLCYPEHLCYFNPSTLHSCMTRYGFQKIYNYTKDISISALLNFLKRNNKDKNKNNLISEQNYYQKISSEKKILKILKWKINLFLRVLGLGTKICAAYKKSD